MAGIRFEQVSKVYADDHLAVDRLDLNINDGEFLVLVGPSGCRKSTALRMVAGLGEISSGRLLIGGKVANELAPRERNLAMIFQSYALYPHLNVAQNIGFPLKVRDMPKSDIAEKVAPVAEMLELLPHLARRPSQGDVRLTRLWWLGWQGVTMNRRPISHKRHRFSPAILNALICQSSMAATT